ncbi:MAG TPA: hypothetical protein VKV03_02135 [Candidatus Binataceae bacterium]|nr:hypothetical protein [Candidatus Binataceae bacterium]
MNVSRRILLLLAAGLVATALAGCFSPLLFLGGLGFTGYQYHEKEGVFAPGQPLGGPAPATDDKNKSASSNPDAVPTPSAANIE